MLSVLTFLCFVRRADPCLSPWLHFCFMFLFFKWFFRTPAHTFYFWNKFISLSIIPCLQVLVYGLVSNYRDYRHSVFRCLCWQFVFLIWIPYCFNPKWTTLFQPTWCIFLRFKISFICVKFGSKTCFGFENLSSLGCCLCTSCYYPEVKIFTSLNVCLWDEYGFKVVVASSNCVALSIIAAMINSP